MNEWPEIYYTEEDLPELRKKLETALSYERLHARTRQQLLRALGTVEVWENSPGVHYSGPFLSKIVTMRTIDKYARLAKE